MSTNKSYRVATIILAAGRSSRLGRPKQLVPFEGRTLLRRAAEAAIYSRSHCVYVVLGAFQRRMREQIRHLDLRVIRNSLWHNGIGSSIKHAVEAVHADDPKLGGYLFMLCDQPLVTEDHIDALLDKFESSDASIVASKCGDIVGVPALFSSKWRQELLALRDDQGAKELILQHAVETAYVESECIRLDIDTPQDLNLLQEAVWSI